MRINCPSCNQALDVGDKPAGMRVRCPNCQHAFRIPRVDAETELADTDRSSAFEAFKGTLLIVSLSAFVILGIAAIILLLRVRDNPGPAKRLVGEWMESMANAGALGLVIALTLLYIAYAILCALMAAWVARDAHARNHSGLGWAVFYLAWHLGVAFGAMPFIVITPFASVGLVTGWTGLAIYLLGRRPGKLSRCPHCHIKRLEYMVTCPHCGTSET